MTILLPFNVSCMDHIGCNLFTCRRMLLEWTLCWCNRNNCNAPLWGRWVRHLLQASCLAHAVIKAIMRIACSVLMITILLHVVNRLDASLIVVTFYSHHNLDASYFSSWQQVSKKKSCIRSDFHRRRTIRRLQHTESA